MPSTTTQGLLRKINFLEVDVDIQKQILFSIPSDQTNEMEKTIRLIAKQTKEIETLREEIKTDDPEEYKRIITFEKAINTFRELASKTKFESIISREIGGECVLEIKGSANVECLIKACDAQENWTIITLDGEIQQYTKSQVNEALPKTPAMTISLD
ncbi:MAG: hypothetical protein COA36_07700 [Desulfotalea sp.]|nr:MAG: hypothetical protein COA36_07700 [Desulfotalea sp.]